MDTCIGFGSQLNACARCDPFANTFDEDAPQLYLLRIKYLIYSHYLKKDCTAEQLIESLVSVVEMNLSDLLKRTNGGK